MGHLTQPVESDAPFITYFFYAIIMPFVTHKAKTSLPKPAVRDNPLVPTMDG